MHTFLAPSRDDIVAQTNRLLARDVLGSQEALQIVQAVIIPHLECCGCDYAIADLREQVSRGAFGSVWHRLTDIIEQEKQAVLESLADSKPFLTSLRRRASAIRLMELLVSPRVRHDVTVVVI